MFTKIPFFHRLHYSSRQRTNKSQLQTDTNGVHQLPNTENDVCPNGKSSNGIIAANGDQDVVKKAPAPEGKKVRRTVIFAAAANGGHICRKIRLTRQKDVKNANSSADKSPKNKATSLRKREVILSRISFYIVFVFLFCHGVRVVPNTYELITTYTQVSAKWPLLNDSSIFTTIYCAKRELIELSSALCSRNFQNVKLRSPIQEFICHWILRENNFGKIWISKTAIFAISDYQLWNLVNLEL